MTLPAGKVCGAEGRRHAERFPGASGQPIRADSGGCRLQAAACCKPRANRSRLPEPHLLSQGTPEAIREDFFRSLPEIILEKAGRPASLPEVVGRAQTRGRRRRGTLSNDAIVEPEVSVMRGSRWEAPWLRGGDMKEAVFVR